MLLAVELAASHVGTLTPAEIADRLGSQLWLLRSGPRDLPRRQQALRSTLLWSYDLLDEPARRIFAALAVFPGGATLEPWTRSPPPGSRSGSRCCRCAATSPPSSSRPAATVP